jgi:hypothetical protein
MPWTAKFGSALLIPTGPVPHLHFVCSDPMDLRGYPPKSCLVFNVSTPSGINPDRTCVIAAGAHPFISHESIIMFGRAQFLQAAAMEQNVASGQWPSEPDADPALVKRILACGDTAPRASGGIKLIAKAAWNKHYP